MLSILQWASAQAFEFLRKLNSLVNLREALWDLFVLNSYLHLYTFSSATQN